MNMEKREVSFRESEPIDTELRVVGKSRECGNQYVNNAVFVHYLSEFCSLNQ